MPVCFHLNQAQDVTSDLVLRNYFCGVQWTQDQVKLWWTFWSALQLGGDVEVPWEAGKRQLEKGRERLKK